MKGFELQNPNEKILISAKLDLDKLVAAYEGYCADKFLIHMTRTDSMFYQLLQRKSVSAEAQAVTLMSRHFRQLCKDAGEVCPHEVLNAFKDAVHSYFNQAFLQHRQVFTSEMMKARDEYQTANLASKLFEKASKAQERALRKKGDVENPVISVGRRSYHLNNYVKAVADYEAREKFWFNELSSAKKKGAIGFEIINNKPQCKDCAELAGKKFYFEQKLTTKLPPLHPGCRCILKAIYADDFDFGVQ